LRFSRAASMDGVHFICCRKETGRSEEEGHLAGCTRGIPGGQIIFIFNVNNRKFFPIAKPRQ
jgi:hypothetical protein